MCACVRVCVCACVRVCVCAWGLGGCVGYVAVDEGVEERSLISLWGVALKN